MIRECVFTRQKCHHPDCKCSECPTTDVWCSEVMECVDLSFEAGKNEMQEFVEQRCRKLGIDYTLIFSEEVKK